MSKYALYIGERLPPYNTEKYTLYNGDKGYALLYSHKQTNQIEGGFKPVPPELMEHLSAKEQKWLLGCQIAINTEHIKEKEGEYAELLTQFAAAWEKELQAEASKQQDRKAAKANEQQENQGNRNTATA